MRSSPVHHAIPNWLLLASVYVFGGASVLLVEGALRHRPAEAPMDLFTGVPGIDAPRGAVLPPGFEKLTLTEAQLRRMGKVMLRTKQRIDSLSGEILPGIQAIRSEQQAGLICILTNQQRTHYSRLDPAAYRAAQGSGLRCGATATE